MSSTVIRPIAICALLLACASSALGQSPAFPPELNTEQNPLRNVSGGALRARAPGDMVSAGVARTLIKANEGRGIIEITEEPPAPDPKATFLIEAIESVFEQINQAILLFENLLRARAGLPPRVPIDLPSNGDTTNGDTDGDTTDDNVTDEDIRDTIDRLN